MKNIFLVACVLLVASCSGGLTQNTQPTPTVWVTPVVVPTVAVADFLPCNSATVSLLLRDETEPHRSWISGTIEPIGKNPALLLDEEYVDQEFSQLNEYYQKAILFANQEGPVCMADYRNLTLEILGLTHHFWALASAGNAKAATEQVLPVISEKLESLSTEVQPVLFKEAGIEE